MFDATGLQLDAVDEASLLVAGLPTERRLSGLGLCPFEAPIQSAK